MKKSFIMLVFVLSVGSLIPANANTFGAEAPMECAEMAWDAYGIAEEAGADKETCSEYADYVFDRCEYEDKWGSGEVNYA